MFDEGIRKLSYVNFMKKFFLKSGNRENKQKDLLGELNLIWFNLHYTLSSTVFFNTSNTPTQNIILV